MKSWIKAFSFHRLTKCKKGQKARGQVLAFLSPRLEKRDGKYAMCRVLNEKEDFQEFELKGKVTA